MLANTITPYKDGCIAIKEFGNIMRSIGHIATNAELQVIKNEVDVGTSYVVEILNRITEMFIKFDEDHNHVIFVAEFRHFATKLDKHEMNVQIANDAVGAYDSDSDEKLNLDEFCNIVIVMIKDRDKFLGVNRNSNGDRSKPQPKS
ncbi:calmodulin-like protein [Trifolium pratense]|uniref:Calmodulin-like protein n=2 Tax=Trifolium pratense TaxID=57577 RepID=A0A2K3MS92_TRIPR|nr:calmodulin-2/4-like [Trifolium pratense]PNX93637.1 calmodulin-like protein [Trifolium pratense]